MGACSSESGSGGFGADASTDSLIDLGEGDTGVDAEDLGVELLPERDVVVAPDGPQDATAPSVRWLNPREGDTLNGDAVVLAVEALDSRGVAEVTFLVDGVVLETIGQEPYEATWTTEDLPSGPYTLSAQATDTAGNRTSDALMVRLQAECEEEPCIPTEIEWLHPEPGESVCRIVGFEVEVRSQRPVDQVQFTVAGQVVGVAAVAPWRVDWDTRELPDGVVTAIAESYEEGGAATFEPIDLTLRNGDIECGPAPAGTFVVPADGAAVRGIVDVRAVTEGEVDSVTLFVDGDRHSSVDEPPFEFAWNSDVSTEGAVSLRLVTAGAHGRSSEAEIEVTVDRTPPRVSITSPFGGAYIDEVPLVGNAVDVGGVPQLSWYRADLTSYADASGIVVVEGAEPVAVSGSDGVGRLVTEDLSAGVYELFVVAMDRAGLSGLATASFVIDRPPSVSIIAPAEREVIGGPIAVRAFVTDDRGPGSLSLWVDGAEVAGAEIEDEGGFAREIVVDWVPVYLAGPRSIRVEVRDDAGRTASDTRSVEVDHAPTLHVELCSPECEDLSVGTVLSGVLSLRPRLVDDGADELSQTALFVDSVEAEEGAGPDYLIEWDSTAVPNGSHELSLRAETVEGYELWLERDIIVAN